MKSGADLRTAVARRARWRCEYCLIHEEHSILSHEVDHVISRQHGGATDAENLAYACMICDRLKGANLASLSAAGELTRLFNPRLDQWEKHFWVEGAVIQPISVVGEVTTRLLQLNTAKRVVERSVLQQLSRYPRA